MIHGSIVARGKSMRLVESEDILAEQRHIKRHKVNLVSQIPIPQGTTFERTESIFLILMQPFLTISFLKLLFEKHMSTGNIETQTLEIIHTLY